MYRTAIRKVHGRRVWDSRGRPTVEAEIQLESGIAGQAIAPAGASTGSGEAFDLRDGGARFGGLDVMRAVQNINGEIARVLEGKDASDQNAIDHLLIDADGTPNKSRLGGNAMIATSMAALHASAAAHAMPVWRYLSGEDRAFLPLPEIQIFGGGAHAAKRMDVQDFMVVCLSAKSFGEALETTAEIYRAAGTLLAKRGLLQGVADEGGYWPAFSSNEEALDALVASIEAAGFVPGVDVGISIDVAASQFREGRLYRLARDAKTVDTGGLIEILGRWIERYPIVSVEDPLAEDDVDGFRRFTAAFRERVQIVGDDLLVTSAGRIQEAAAEELCNAVLIKPNQAGTITETLAALQAACSAGLAPIISARSGETEDVTIVHLCVGWKAPQLKVGSFSRSERMAKWNEVLRIEDSLGRAAIFTRLADAH